MTAVLDRPVLVLNKHFAALRVAPAAEAIADLFVGRVQAVDTDYQTYDFHSWRELSAAAHEYEPASHTFVRSVSDRLLVPSVVRLLRFEKFAHDRVRLSRRNVYLRDEYTCQYTGRKLPASRLNLDHVQPQSRGGETNWTNLVCCDAEINSKKRDRTPGEAGLSLVRKPYKPTGPELLVKAMRHKQQHWPLDTWKHFVDAAYWNTSLTDE